MFDSQSDSISAKTQNLIDEYEKIGIGHNENLKEYIASSSDIRLERSSSNDKLIAFCFNYYNSSQNDILFSDGKIELLRGEQPISLVESLTERGDITELESVYMQEIENILYSAGNSIEEVKSKITEVENRAIQVLNETSLPMFMSYAETAKASFSFWTENSEILNSDATSRMVWWKLAGIVAGADAAGAAEGVIVAAALKIVEPSLITAAGVLCGAASSAMTLEKEEFTLLIPIEKLLDLLK